MSLQTLNENLDIIQNLVIPLLEDDLDNIQKLDDEPNDVGGLSAAELKAEFDKAGNTIKGYLNETLIPQLSDTVAEAEVRATAERERVANENIRVANENIRVANENIRVANENIRVENEDARQGNETARVNAEKARADAESSRKNAESQRATEEKNRESQEAARKSNETARESAESTRKTQESDRQTAENERDTNENLRQVTESTRVAAERIRKEQENSRATAEKLRVDAEEARVAAEKIREEAHQSRKVVQTTGDSTTAVMSQKAVTDALANAGGGGVTNAVLYTEQTLTEEQQAQARDNIGAQVRTHWADVEEIVIFERNVTLSENNYTDLTGEVIPFVEGDTYTVEWDGVFFDCVCKPGTFMGLEMVGVGNQAILGSGENTEEPFVIGSIVGLGWGVFALTDGEHSFRIIGKAYNYHTIPPEYIGGSKPYYIDLANAENNVDIAYTTEATQAEVLDALLSGYQVVVRRANPKYNLFDFFVMAYQANNKALMFYRIDRRNIDQPAYETLFFEPNKETGGYDITHRSWVMARSDEIPKSLRNPYALTINGMAYDGSKAVSLTIGGDDIPDYVRAEAERVAKVVQSRQNANTITFLACSDIHYYSPSNATSNVNADKMHEAVVSMGQAMGLIRERCHIDFAAMLGDMTWDYGETHDEDLAEMRFINTCLSEGFGSLPQLRMEGNHDDGYESGAGLTAGEIFANIGAWNDGAVYGDRAAGYCYRDFEDVKLRVIALNSSQYSGSAAQYNTEQVTWLTEVLDLSEKGDDWCSIVVGHHPLDWGRNGGVDPVPVVKSAVGLIGTFHGHIHNFLVGDITGTEVKRIAIPNAGYSRENQYNEAYGVNWKESTTYSKTPGTAQNTSFCVVTIDLAAQKIYADHYGAGYSREIDYIYKPIGAGYTNLVPTSIDPATGNIYGVDYNGDGTPDGYKNDVYASSSGEGSSPDTDCVLTGLIPYGDDVITPIYIKGADITTASHCRILSFNGSYEVSKQSAAGSAISTCFTVETLGTSYYKVTPTTAWKDEPGFDDYLRFSLINPDGGANLIITVGEPIE